MATLTSQLVISLINRVTAPARAINSSLDSLRQKSARNAVQMRAAQTDMLGAAAVAYGLAKAIASPVKVAANFEASMNRVTALSGASGEQFDKLRQQALNLGRTTQFTASQAGDAMGFLAMAGFQANDILGAMPGTLQLAASAQMDLASTADIVSNVLTGYNKDVSELGHVNDVLVKAFTSANTDLRQLGEAMKYVGPVASSAGVQFEETAAALSLMGNAGIQGTMAGTSLRGAISRILSPTKAVKTAMKSAGLSFTDANGKLLPLIDIVKRLEPHAENAGLFMQLFGQRAGPAMAALVGQGSDALAKLTSDLENSAGTAERIANVQMAGLKGLGKQVASAFEGVQIALGTALIPALTALGNALIPVLSSVTQFIEANPQLAAAVFGSVAALVALKVATIASRFAFFFLKGAMLDAAIAMTRSAGIMKGGLLLALAPLRLVTGAAKAARSAMIGYAAAASVVGRKSALGIAAKGLATGFLSLLNPLKLVTGALRLLKVVLVGTGIGAIVVGIATAGTLIYNNWSGISAMFQAFGTAFMQAIAPIRPALDPVVSGLEKLKALWERLTGSVGSDQSWAEFGESAGRAVGKVVLYFAELPGKIIRAIGSINLSSLIKWPTPPSWLRWLMGGGNAKATVAGPSVDGARAAGGNIVGGKTYLVGEKGPELVTPSRSGYVNDANRTSSLLSANGNSATGPTKVDVGGISLTVVQKIGEDSEALAQRVSEMLGQALADSMSGGQYDKEYYVS